MFKMLEYRGILGFNERYMVRDDYFNEMIYVPYTPSFKDFRANIIKELLLLYEKRDIPCAPNIAKFYLDRYITNHDAKELKHDRDLIDQLYPFIMYGKKYFPCIINHIKRLTYAKNI